MKHKETAKRLQKAMLDANINARELSKKSGVAESSISHYYHGTHQPSNISAGRLGEVLKVSPLWLMGFEVEKDFIPMTDEFAVDAANIANEVRRDPKLMTSLIKYYSLPETKRIKVREFIDLLSE